MLTLKNYKQANARDGVAFSASLYLAGKRAGEVTQSGNGGPNDYDLSRADMATATTEAKAWAKADGYPYPDSVEILDAYVEHLLAEMELRKVAERNKRKGLPVTVVIFTGPYKMGEFTLYDRMASAGFRSLDTLPAFLAKHKPAKHKVIDLR